MPASYPVPTQMVQQLWGRFITFLMRSYPMKDLPLNIRPGMIFATAIWIIILGILGMAPLPELPVNDKALHFFGLGFATYLIYFILEVPDGAGKRIWYIRRAPLLFTLVTAFFVGGIISEFIQSLLPWKEFQFGDIVANLLGSTLFLYLAHLTHQRNQRKLELSSLYEPLTEQGSSTYRDAQGRRHQFNASSLDEEQPPRVDGAVYGGAGNRARQGSNVWDDESDQDRSSQDTARGGGGVFELGDEDDESTPVSGKR
ncbi:hypothetical protein I302_102999 [Kwoniella bestiolae CBS 10118]|uniref:VanZ-like domain-containing protein n=1 Tax=Kwoniella bestiolae CBS 10118 TaxID=1296100 RepID=A0A1B9GGN5_9TREE|nr:hypothetical protein I302_01695 [Kwoniella bestiolae CBS 10118]OCF30176.1 hypothetical protein I302_01695 [Kwoniella bestiolae CBS 10118]